jgi:hypothetical protein
MPIHPINRLLVHIHSSFCRVGPIKPFDFKVAMLAEGAGEGWQVTLAMR